MVTFENPPHDGAGVSLLDPFELSCISEFSGTLGNGAVLIFWLGWFGVSTRLLFFAAIAVDLHGCIL